LLLQRLLPNPRDLGPSLAVTVFSAGQVFGAVAKFEVFFTWRFRIVPISHGSYSGCGFWVDGRATTSWRAVRPQHDDRARPLPPARGDKFLDLVKFLRLGCVSATPFAR
jgi:hypothetical protein